MLITIIQILLALMFVMAGLPKFASKQQIEAFETYGYPQWFRIFTGVVEIVIGLLLIIGIWIHQLAAIGGFLVIATMIGAMFTHIKFKDSFKNMVLPIVLLIFGGIAFWQNASALLG
ncbi:DoxX family protein [Evansella clarkii]|uniref:DoxX family protein n=1 Tax=Evansella clarkii TaxID=79879 RepID=UPI000B450355|nr:DoxX family protein [Evansella clarkii]